MSLCSSQSYIAADKGIIWFPVSFFTGCVRVRTSARQQAGLAVGSVYSTSQRRSLPLQRYTNALAPRRTTHDASQKCILATDHRCGRAERGGSARKLSATNGSVASTSMPMAKLHGLLIVSDEIVLTLGAKVACEADRRRLRPRPATGLFSLPYSMIDWP